VRIGAPTVTGGMAREVVRRVIDRQRNKFQYCYEKHLLVDSRVQGTLKVALEILPSGKPENVGTLGIEGEVAACTKRVLEYVEFPKPQDGKGVAVKFELTLKP
jgi:hypothetical protein